MGELIDQQPLFPGDNDIDQLYKVQLVLGPITDQQLKALEASPRYAHVKFPPLPPPEGLHNRYAGRFDKVALDFLQRLLLLEPQQRMTAAEALQHPYISYLESAAPQQLLGSVHRKRKLKFVKTQSTKGPLQGPPKKVQQQQQQQQQQQVAAAAAAAASSSSSSKLLLF
ncbi:LOW QUALITY PROTEIN: Kinase, CMGC CDKL, related [Eimeria necatrix]|uniref:Kinase, CMGC CDKL, related n=1 Tax=Eimeria necatrix TaxID=51315 RepID=U6N1D7_9EIME|nr:LOW QUALITY PROTEIN: Kinase, CMGC CDKL, related [Eimeria necatrix]CDJ69113.1 Kinase, CMGC CDKL, related [Eimeria necatrix]